MCVKLAWLLRMKKFETENEKIEGKKIVKKHSIHQTDVEYFQGRNIEKSFQLESDTKCMQKSQTHVPQHDDKVKDDDEEEENELKCKFAAIVLDRFFFYLTLVYAIITFVALLMSITNFYK